MEPPPKGYLHSVAARIFRSAAEWLISRGLASERLRWRVRRFEQRGFRALLGVTGVYYPYAIIAINVALMVIVLLFAALGPSASTDIAWGVVLVRFGAAVTRLIFAGDYWRLLTAVFLHMDFTHLLFNCVAIWVIAPRIEAIYGPRRFLVVYLLTGVAGNVSSVFIHAFFAGQPILLVGSSGAVFGLLGAGAIYGLRTGGPQGEEIFKFMAVWIGIGILYSFLVRGDNLAHAGGAIAGGLFAQVLRPHAAVTYHRRLWVAIEAGCLLLTAICFAYMLHSLFTREI